MAAAGIASPFAIDDSRSLASRQFRGGLPTILRRIRETADAVIAARPDALVIIDSPDFTHRVARRVRRWLRPFPILDYVSPSVWAWRPWRARSMRAYIDCVLAILPFEPAAHFELGGPPCIYVGHPMIERVAELRPQRGRTEAPQQRSPAGAGAARQPRRRDRPPFWRYLERPLPALAPAVAPWTWCCRRCRISSTG